MPVRHCSSLVAEGAVGAGSGTCLNSGSRLSDEGAKRSCSFFSTCPSKSEGCSLVKEGGFVVAISLQGDDSRLKDSVY